MAGIRKLGVMSGQAFACSKETEQPQVGQSVIDLATQVSLHFGLQAADDIRGGKMTAIGKRLGFSAERASQLEQRALKKLAESPEMVALREAA